MQPLSYNFSHNKDTLICAECLGFFAQNKVFAPEDPIISSVYFSFLAGFKHKNANNKG